MTETLLKTLLTNFGEVNRGKVRDIYDLKDRLLIVTTDRLSAFDEVLPDGIPGKGVVLNQLSNFWFKQLEKVVSNHLLFTDADEFPRAFTPYLDPIRERCVIVRKTEPLPVECIVRGYITGSGWKSYEKDGTVCGIILPRGLQESEKLLDSIYTPSTKAEAGKHDENISFKTSISVIKQWLQEKFEDVFTEFKMDIDETATLLAARVRNLSVVIYNLGAAFALKKGIIIADTKFEFGLEFKHDTKSFDIILIDEVLTPDSSRFWPLVDYKIGQSQNSFDKQIVRDWLIKVYGWDKKAPAPELPKEIIQLTTQKYQTIQNLLLS